jgi:hypothetical protein
VPPPPGPPAPVAPPAPHEVAVIVDSTPPGAHILRDGAVVGDTPDAIKVGAPTQLVLHKDGFADKTITVDPSQHKLQVKLERTVKPVALKPGPSASKVAGAAPSRSKSNQDAPLEPYAGAPVAAAAPRTETAAAGAAKSGAPAPAAAAKTSPPPSSPHVGKPAAGDGLSGRVDKQASTVVPGGKRIGEVYKGSAPKAGGRSDWYVQLPAGRCFTFVGEAGAGVRGLYLYLWGPDGKRVKDARVRTEHATMPYCTVVAGQYHLQAKISDGSGEYGVGIYQQK